MATKKTRIWSVYVIAILLFVVGVEKLFGLTALVIGNPLEANAFNVGFLLGIIDFLLIPGIVLGKRWGWIGTLAFSVIGILAGLGGSLQAWSYGITGFGSGNGAVIGPLAPVVPILLDVIILILLTRSSVKSYYSRTR